MTKAARTRQYIIEKTAPLFNTKGYEGTSLADIQHVTGLTKGALYGNFSDKEAIATAAFLYAVDRVREAARQKLETENTVKQQLLALLDFYAAYVLDPPIEGGCPLLNSAIEVDDHRTSMRSVVVNEMMATVNFISDLITNGVKAGEFKSHIDPKAIAYTMFCCIEGAIMYARVERSREPMDIIVRHCKQILDNISKQ